MQPASQVPQTLCPFCKAPVAGALCGQCNQDPTAARRVCKGCGGVTPSDVSQCIRCGKAHRSDMPGKIIIIVLLFAAAFAVSIAVHMS